MFVELAVKLLLTTLAKDPVGQLLDIGSEQDLQSAALFHVTIRGNGPKIVEAVPSDVLVVRAHTDTDTSVS